jgi:hypothetical protein
MTPIVPNQSREPFVGWHSSHRSFLVRESYPDYSASGKHHFLSVETGVEKETSIVRAVLASSFTTCFPVEPQPWHFRYRVLLLPLLTDLTARIRLLWHTSHSWFSFMVLNPH